MILELKNSETSETSEAGGLSSIGVPYPLCPISMTSQNDRLTRNKSIERKICTLILDKSRQGLPGVKLRRWRML